MRILTFLVASIILSWLVGKCLGPLGWMDHPNGRRQHHAPVPRTGGIVLLILSAVAVLSGWLCLPFSVHEYLAILGIGLIGFVDDRIQIRARWKALSTLLLAFVLAREGANHLMTMGQSIGFLGFTLPHVWGLYFLLLTLLYWSIPQAFNLVDGADGLALGLSLIIIFVVGSTAGSTPMLLVSILVGLLALNWPKAKHFIGDCGALTIGATLAVFSFKTLGAYHPNALLWIFAYPTIDVSMVVIIRLLKKQNLGEGDRNHLHHQWQDRFPRLRGAVVPFLWALGGACAYGAIATDAWRFVSFAALAVMVLQALVFIGIAYFNHLKDMRMKVSSARALCTGEIDSVINLPQSAQ